MKIQNQNQTYRRDLSQIYDLWHLAVTTMSPNMDADYQANENGTMKSARDCVLEVWHQAHDMKALLLLIESRFPGLIETLQATTSPVPGVTPNTSCSWLIYDTSNDWYQDTDTRAGERTGEVLTVVAEHAKLGEYWGTVKDGNGNTTGHWRIAE